MDHLLEKETPKGFTLVEVLLVAVIFSVLSLALFHTFTDGIKIWDRSRQFVVEEDIAILFDKMAMDLRNCYFFSSLPFKGEEDRVQFATRIRSERFPNDTTLGQVEYYYKPETGEVFRRELNYGQAFSQHPGIDRKLAGSIKGVRFSYFYTENNVLQVQPRLDALIPSGVAVEIDFDGPQGRQLLRKLILLSVEI